MAGKVLLDDARLDDRLAEDVQCHHHWAIDMAAGPVSMGICQTCGTRKEFHNYLSECLADKDKETYEAWLARQGQKERRRAKARRGSMTGIGED